MTELARNVITALKGKTLCTAESCTGGGIGGILTGVPGSSAVFKGGVISYCNEIKANVLSVPESLLEEKGAVCGQVAQAMAMGARKLLCADVAVSVTGLAGPGGDEYGNPVGTVFIGYCDANICISREFHFAGDREAVRNQAITESLKLILENQEMRNYGY